ncbi:MAG: gamma-glutamylcyclotransferase [Gemmobacter sp.]
MMHSSGIPAPLWVFGYGSLMWQPEFPVAEARVARVAGWHRRFCMWSIHHRGTPEAPGLVLALDAGAGAVCHGLVLRAEPGTEAETLARLRERELVSSAYLETQVAAELVEGGQVQALAYVIDPGHVQYTGPLSLEAQAQIIARACGGRGRNCDYLWATVAHLAALGLADPELDWLASRVRDLLDG